MLSRLDRLIVSRAYDNCIGSTPRLQGGNIRNPMHQKGARQGTTKIGWASVLGVLSRWELHRESTPRMLVGGQQHQQHHQIRSEPTITATDDLFDRQFVSPHRYLAKPLNPQRWLRKPRKSMGIYIYMEWEWE